MGEDGPAGETGDRGDPGRAGENGVDGEDGAEGRDGEDGSDGVDGQDGLDGMDGMDGADGADAPTRTIDLEGENVFPEGIAIDEAGNLYIGSFLQGSIVRVDPDSRQPVEFIAEGLQNAAGLSIAEGALWVCNSALSTGFDALAEVVGFDLESGQEIARHPFPEPAGGPTLCNDLSFDGDGNLYATDSFQNQVLRIADADLSSDSALEVWASDAIFAENFVEGFGLNGIAFDGVDNVYVASHATGELFRVTIGSDGGAEPAVPVPLLQGGDERLLLQPDGIEMTSETTLMVAEQGGNWLARVDLETGSVTPTAGGLDNPSTLVFDESGDSWVVNSQLNDFASGTAPTLPFQVVKIPLD